MEPPPHWHFCSGAREPQGWILRGVGAIGPAVLLLPRGPAACRLAGLWAARGCSPSAPSLLGAAAEQGLPAGSPLARSFGSKEWSFSPKDKYGLCSFCGSSALGPRFVSPSRLVLQQPGWRQKHQERCLLLTGGLVSCFNIFFFLTETVGSEKCSSSKTLLPLQSTVGLVAWDKHIPCD